MTERGDTGAGIEAGWEQLRAEERAAQLARVAEDSERDARISELLAAKAARINTAAVNGAAHDH